MKDDDALKPKRPRQPAAADEASRADADDPSDPLWREMGSTRVLPDASQPAPPQAGRLTHHEEDTAIVSSSKKDSGELSVLGDFQLLERLGEGAMGAVYKARQISCDRQVALKVLFPHIGNNPKLVERLYREGRVMGQLDHPNIVQAVAVDSDQGCHFIAMEFVDGDSLQKWLDRLGRLPLPDALLVTMTVARALEYAHTEGKVVHRDIKPDNILITRKGVIKVADFGMVKTADEDMHLTQTGHAVGTPWYMPLEQAKNAKETDGRSDIYALGCMLYCMLTGNPPFVGRTIVEVIQSKEIGTFPPARSLNADVPERLDLVIAKMTAKSAKYRYQSCADVVRDLEALNLAGKSLEFLQGKAPKRTTNLDRAAPAGSRSIEENLDVWYVNITHGDGGSTISKLTTAQVKKMLDEGSLNPTAMASHHTRQGFRALATYKEFQGSALSRVSKKAADAQGARFRSLMKKIEEKDRQREEKERSQEKEVHPLARYWQALWLPSFCVAGGILVLFFLWYIASGLMK